MQLHNSSRAGKFFDFYLFGNLHVALCAVALTFASAQVLDMRMKGEWWYVVFGGTLALYSYQRWIGVKQKENVTFAGVHHQWNIRNESLLLALSVSGIVLAGIAVISLSKQAWFVILLTGFLSLLYSAPIFNFKGKRKRLRDLTGAKIFLIAITWALVCVWIPVADQYEPSLINVFSAEYSYIWKWTLVCFLLTFSLTVPFDIRDMEFDKGVLRSLPMIFGEKRMTRIAVAAMLLSAFIFWRFEVRIAHSNWPDGVWKGYAIWALISAAVLSRCNSKRSEYYFSFWIDGMILLLPFALMIG
jgi:hypothetical protein